MGATNCHMCKKPVESEMEMNEESLPNKIDDKFVIKEELYNSVMGNENEEIFEVAKNRNLNSIDNYEESLEIQEITENPNIPSVSSSSTKEYKQSKNFNVTNNSKVPLEIINEIHGDLKEDSNRENLQEIKFNSKKEILNKFTEEKEIEKVIKKTEKIEQSQKKDEEYLDENKEIEIIAKKEENRKSFLAKLAKNIATTKETPDAWRSMSITQVIPEKILLNSDEDELLFQGELFKYTHPLVSQRGTQPYSSKFCVITRTEIKIFRSKEAFLRLQNPLQKIPFFSIISTNKIQVPSKDKNKKYFNFYLELINMNNGKDDHNKISKQNHFDTNLSKIMNDSNSKSGHKRNISISKMEDSTESSDKKVRKISALDDKAEDDLIKILNFKNEINLSNPNILIFASITEEMINKWLCVINYFISK